VLACWPGDAAEEQGRREKNGRNGHKRAKLEEICWIKLISLQFHASAGLSKAYLKRKLSHVMMTSSASLSLANASEVADRSMYSG
jgi:hypothetical protein